MNVYVLTEGAGEKELYKEWIHYINPQLNFVDFLDDVRSNNYFILSANGYPQYFEIIKNSIEEINEINIFDRFVILVDSENMSKNEKYLEIENFLNQFHCYTDVRIIIQHFCVEAWALGNRKVIRSTPKPTSTRLKEFKKYYDVSNKDPELLPPFEKYKLNRAQFAAQYLKYILNDRYRNLTYTKSNPKELKERYYFNEVKKRLYETEHISSFRDFLEAFV